MLDLYADWKMVGQDHGQEEKGTKRVVVVEGCLAAYVRRKEVVDQGKGWAMREICLHGHVMAKREI